MSDGIRRGKAPPRWLDKGMLKSVRVTSVEKMTRVDIYKPVARGGKRLKHSGLYPTTDVKKAIRLALVDAGYPLDPVELERYTDDG